MVGRSNVGKSSLINALAKRNGLANTSKTPGRTQLLNCFELPDGTTMVDCPGYGYAKVSKVQRASMGSMIERYLLGRDELQMVMVLVDGEVGPTALDQSMLEWLRSEGLPHQVIATKHDKVKAAQREKRKRAAGGGVRPRAGRRRVGERGQERRHRPPARPRADLAQPLSERVTVARWVRWTGHGCRRCSVRERAAFAAARPRSAAAATAAAAHLIGGVPMTWMAKWAGGFPIFLDRGRGQPRHRPRRSHLRRLRARRHRRDGRPLAAGHRRGRATPARGPRRHHRHAPHRGRGVGGRRADARASGCRAGPSRSRRRTPTAGRSASPAW